MDRLKTFSVKNWIVLGQKHFDPPLKVTDSLINEARIVHVIKGKSVLYSANQSTTLYDGDTVIMKTDNFVNSWFENETGIPNHVIVFQLNSEFLHSLYNDHLPEWFKSTEGDDLNPVEKINHSELLDSYFDNLQKYFDHSEVFTEEIIQLKIKELIAIIIQTDTTSTKRKLFGNLFKIGTYSFQETIQENLFENLGLEDLAFLTQMSLSSFKRKFSSIYGTSPNKYIISRRLEKAQLLLKTTDFHISDIAEQCGFSDLSYFSKTFRKNYNISPSEIRKAPLN